MSEEVVNRSAVTGTEEKSERLWNLNFLLLWQGQLISCLGDVAYEIALGFWVLAVTGSTGLMGTLMAASTLPRVIISPFAGVWVDRTDRRKMLITMDWIRGICVSFVGVAAVFHFIQIWMVFVTGVILGICGAFFSPAVSSSIPDIVPKSKIIAANSTYQAINAGSNLIGNSAGGFLFQLLGAPVLFLANGISYLFSGTISLFIKIPKIKQEKQEFHFKQDLKEGMNFVWSFKPFAYLIAMAAVLNFFASIGMILFLPFFQKNPALGASKYGISMAIFTGGVLAGMVVISLLNIKPSKRWPIFVFAGIFFSLFIVVFPLISIFPLQLLSLFLGGFLNAIVNTFIGAIIQMTVPQNMRGKVSSLMSAVCQGLTPIGMAIGGILAEFISIKMLICGSFIISGLAFVPLCFSSSTKKFINFDPEKDTLEGLMKGSSVL